MLDKSPTYDRDVLERLIYESYRKKQQGSPDARKRAAAGWPLVVNLAAKAGFQSAKLVEAASYGGIDALPKPPRIGVTSPSIPFLPRRGDDPDSVDVRAIAEDVRNLLIKEVGKKNFNKHVRRHSKMHDALHTVMDARQDEAVESVQEATGSPTKEGTACSRCSISDFYDMNHLI